MVSPAHNEVLAVLAEAKALAKRYRALTGRPLGITGEVAEFEAARLLNLELAPVRTAGYDAIERSGSGERRLQIKSRCLLPNCKPGQRLGGIDIAKEWDAVLMVLLDENLDAIAIYEASRDAVLSAITKPGSKARNVRGALGLRQFKAIATCRWQRAAA